ncbi:SDR family NAD(P)-dependent oxidoreductase [Actinomadura sp. NAK00032]|uniref:type I polyketide synthase n=1 Tax=Actinomadura sp. NAK00032 TaxID=2742128 RepID=UPI0015906FCC|nr:type I polyketide synthase [Actinomadura sp. NAK00032]QKW37147.1 SDR family NAD(P)-dependent oxidoreductase [Actinomadura sp. NAK00032]
MGERPGGTDGRAVAIVGAGCRLPGGITGLDGLWAALERGDDLVGQVPPERFEADRFVDERMPRASRSYTRAGGFLTEDPGGFDAAFFGISPKEAAAMDPQQRLLLETAVEALDDAGIDPASLAGSDTGVFIGISDPAYGVLQMLEPCGIGPYTMSGSTLSIASNRLSQVFDLRGPSMSIDTACSSSLLAVERGWRTLVEGRSRVVLAGGMHLLLSPGSFVGFSQASMLSPTGRCRAFSADADGFVRAEGGGLVVLKRLADALADGDRVHAVILGAGTNNDGRTFGLSLPSPDAQEQLLRQVYTEAGVAPDEVVYVEAHGTGTQAGDPAECLSLGRALGAERSGGPLPIGSVKSNMGHLEPASGMPGLFKAMLVLRNRLVPPTLHAGTPNPAIDFDGLGLRVATRPVPLDGAAARPVAGVNSFGFGGANVHVALTVPPPSEEGGAAGGHPANALPLVVSARTPAALREAARQAAGVLASTADQDFYDIAYTSCRRRGTHPHRAAVVADSPAGAARALTRLLDGDEGGGEAAFGEAVEHGRVALVFSGNGAQWAGMAADLLGDEVFREAVEALDAELAPRLGWSVLEELAVPAERWCLAATEVAQPLLFAVQAGLAEMLKAAGVRPACVLGHSVGEVAAAYVSGALSSAQAAQVIAERSTAQARARGWGRMAAVGLPEDAARRLLAGHPGVEVAAVNTDRDVTVAGPEEALTALGEELAAGETFFRMLDLEYPFHSSAMDPVRDGLLEALAGLRPDRTRIPLVSTVTGGLMDGPDLNAAYWWRNVREPVRFAAAVERVADEGCDVLLEVGPHPVLRSYLRRVIGKARPRAAVAATLRRGEPGPSAMRAAVAHLIASGARVDWDRHFPRPGRVRPLPAYPWQRERYWIGGPGTWISRFGDPAVQHPLLGERLPVPYPAWAAELDPGRLGWLLDHKAGGAPVMPATGYLEMMAAAGRLGLPEAAGAVEVDRIDIARALVLSAATGTEPTCASTTLYPETGVVVVAGAEDRTRQPRENCRGRVRRLLRPVPPPVDVAELRARIGEPVDVEDFYARAAKGHMEWGPHFRVLTGLWRAGKEILGSYSCDAQEDGAYQAHPVVLDSALQAGVVWLVDEMLAGRHYMPAAIASMRLWGRPSPQGLLHVRERSRYDDEVCWDITVTDPDGNVSAEILGCRLRAVRGIATRLTRYETVLRAAPRPGGADERGTADGVAPVAEPQLLLDEAAGTADRALEAWRGLDYPRFAARAEEAFAHAVARALRAPGADGRARPFDPRELLRSHAASDHRRLLEPALPLLERHGLMGRLGPRQLRWTTPPAGPDTLHEELVWRGNAFAAHAALTVLIGTRLPDLLAGRETAAGLLAGGGADLLEQFHRAGPLCTAANRVVRAAVEGIVRRWPADRPLRVLELGAGTGGTTDALLPALPADRTRYTATDADEAVVNRLRQRFAASDLVEYAALDIDRAPAGQDVAEGAFDLVVAVNVLHLAEDVTAALDHARALLAPGGLLLAAEPHRLGALLPVFGLLAEFWRFADRDVRPDSPLLPREQWSDLLVDAGFTAIGATGDGGEPEHGDFSVLLAGAPQPAAAQARRTAPARLPRAGEGDAWVIAAEDGPGAAGALADVLRDRGARVARSGIGTDPGEWALKVPADARKAAFCVLLGDAEDDTGEDAASGPAAEVERITRRVAALRAIALACEQLPHDLEVSLWLAARPCGALPETGEPEGSGPEGSGPEAGTHPRDAAVWGAARSLGNEHPSLRVRRVCLTPTGDPALDAERLAAEMLAPDDEEEIVLTRRGRFVPRLREAPAATVPSTGVGDGCELAVRDPGRTFTLEWRQKRRAEPRAGEVAIEVRAAGLNYRDVMRAAGLLPVEAVEAVHGWHELGLECAGVVSAVGPGVTDLEPGDRVLTAGPVGIGDHAVVAAWMAMPVPDGLTFTQAATLPMAFVTATHSLIHCARLRAGETVLVHGGAGGVGLAALQVARACGARVIATAGSPAKRDLLRALGAEHVLDSRSLRFADQVMELTDGRGVDVVLNSLAGEAITRGLEVLRHGGRFIELGKRDIFENKPLLLRPFGDNISLFGVDVGTLQWKDPERAAREITACYPLMRTGGVTALPHTVLPAARVGEAFALMGSSRHIGKIVVSFGHDEPFGVRPRRTVPALDPDGTYLVTGGLTGFGAATARWLARRGARHLALVGRRGAGTPEAPGLLADLRALGADARAYAADAADRAAMERVLRDMDADGRPLRGVVHAAMHLDDAPLAELSDDRIRAVLHPKIAGALVLDDLTGDRDLDMFVMYSSISALGNIGQSAYAAANLYLEALARLRRRRGRTALTVALGALSETGVLARDAQGGTLAAVFGGEATRPAEALAAIEDMLAEQAGVAMVGRCDWGRLSQVMPGLRRPMTAALLPAGLDEEGTDRTRVLEALAAMDREQALAFLVAEIRQVLSEVLLLPAGQIAVDRRLDEYGMDSLMGGELMASVRTRYGIDIPPLELLRSGGTIADIAQIVLVRLGLSTTDAATPTPPSPPRPRPPEPDPVAAVPTGGSR